MCVGGGVLTCRVLRCCQRGHGVGEVEVGSDAELALGRRWIRRRGGPQRLLAPVLIDPGQIDVNQCVQKLHNQLSVVRDLVLLWAA